MDRMALIVGLDGARSVIDTSILPEWLHPSAWWEKLYWRGESMQESDEEKRTDLERRLEELGLDPVPYGELAKELQDAKLLDLVGMFGTWIMVADQRLARIEEALNMPKGKGLMEIAQWVKEEAKKQEA